MSSKAQFRALSEGFHVPAHRGRSAKLEVANCDLKLGRPPELAVRIYGTWRGHAFGCAGKRARNQDERPDHRAFVRLREFLANHKELAMRVQRIEDVQHRQTWRITILAEEISDLKRLPPPGPKRRIGFPRPG